MNVDHSDDEVEQVLGGVDMKKKATPSQKRLQTSGTMRTRA